MKVIILGILILATLYISVYNLRRMYNKFMKEEEKKCKCTDCKCTKNLT